MKKIEKHISRTTAGFDVAGYYHDLVSAYLRHNPQVRACFTDDTAQSANAMILSNLDRTIGKMRDLKNFGILISYLLELESDSLSDDDEEKKRIAYLRVSGLHIITNSLIDHSGIFDMLRWRIKRESGHIQKKSDLHKAIDYSCRIANERINRLSRVNLYEIWIQTPLRPYYFALQTQNKDFMGEFCQWAKDLKQHQPAKNAKTKAEQAANKHYYDGQYRKKAAEILDYARKSGKNQYKELRAEQYLIWKKEQDTHKDERQKISCERKKQQHYETLCKAIAKRERAWQKAVCENRAIPNITKRYLKRREYHIDRICQTIMVRVRDEESGNATNRWLTQNETVSKNIKDCGFWFDIEQAAKIRNRVRDRPDILAAETVLIP